MRLAVGSGRSVIEHKILSALILCGGFQKMPFLFQNSVMARSLSTKLRGGVNLLMYHHSIKPFPAPIEAYGAVLFFVI